MNTFKPGRHGDTEIKDPVTHGLSGKGFFTGRVIL